MNRGSKHILRLLGQSVAFWIFAMCCYVLFRFLGIESESAFLLKEGYDSQKVLKETLIIFSISGLGLGVLYFVVDYFLEKYLSKKFALGLQLLLKASLYFLVTIIVASLAGKFAVQFFKMNIDIKPGWWIHDRRFWSVQVYVILSSFVFLFLRIAAERFGEGVFLKILVGAYKNPKEQERIFMFLDLKDSTTIAEKIGHKKYSQFIQDCFYDLNKVLLRYEGEIYQYVGDEAVLTWSYKKGISKNNCVDLFFAFQKEKASRAAYYNKKYGIFPEFKAGLHGGTLMATEVGFVKKELAYHGDVINTTARIQAACNAYNTSLLVSEGILNDLKTDNIYTTDFIGEVQLKGKNQQVKIHSIQ